MTVDITAAATDPRRDASVHAAAGTGKTWLLVTRVVRLLLDGVRPDRILAITFTRKAAAEMEQRIMERLQELAAADHARCSELLLQAGVTVDTDSLARAGRLYETVLCQPRRLRCTTFHAFCNELLTHFPLEAGVVPGFELVEKTGQLERAAYEAMLVDSIRAPASRLARSLDELAETCGSLASARQALYSFLAQRSDWWAWTETGSHDRQACATAGLAQFLDTDPDADPLDGYPDDRQRARHGKFAALLRDNTPGDAKLAAGIEAALADSLSGDAFLQSIRGSYLTAGNSARKRKTSASQQRRLGAARDAEFMELHAQGCDEVLAQLDAIARQRSLLLNNAWFRAGSALLDHYQRIKRERRLLDHTDLEWLACRLLNRGEHAEWVQYKLDARIDHLLVDEFQDTNPTQWRLLLPLLQELSAGDSGRERSVFLVGDVKQSIYRFRRANPALLGTASDWLQAQRGAEQYPLNLSRRSAPAIIDCVNRVFARTDAGDRLAEFANHDTVHKHVYGRVELLPLCTGPESTDDSGAAHTTLRNPLHEPRVDSTESASLQEGRQVAQSIRQLVDSKATVERDDTVRTIGYGDIIILLRQRTHAAVYEQALREAGIPCLGASRGLLLDNLEIRDLVALLECLVTPFDNLALAQVLRSPLFGIDSEQLLPLATGNGGYWFERLRILADRGSAPWRSMYDLLTHWSALAGQLPVHDLLDRIFHEGEVLQRYQAAFPPLLQPRVQASFTRFLELALELDNGRYPSLPRFLGQLNGLRQDDRDLPDEHAPDAGELGRVQLMTVHAAKGLEAAAIYLVDAARVPTDRDAWQGVVDWPHDAERPARMLLATGKSLRDSRTNTLLERQSDAAATEDANLLYVALTRARQYLFVSGNARPGTTKPGWYGVLESAMDDAPRNSAGHAQLESNTPPAVTGQGRQPAVTADIPAALSRPVSVPPQDLPIAPSRQVLASTHGHVDGDARARGIALHLMLERLTAGTDDDRACLYIDIASQLQRTGDDPELQAWWQEACAVVDDPDLSALFDETRYRQAWNEVAVQYLENDRMIHGVIDRLLLTGSDVLIVDYKSHRLEDDARVPALLEEYRPQLEHYAGAAQRLWPGLPVRSGLLFTGRRQLAWLDPPGG